MVRIDANDGGCWRVTFGASKGNILDSALMTELTEMFREAERTPELRAICLEGQGAHFSFGASVPEHLPEHAAGMLECFGGLVRALIESSVVVLAAVRGQCLGGGLELATLCHRVFAAADARLGQPEILLGVFPPIACALLADRIGRGPAEDVCLTGRIVSASDALRMGLVDEVVDGDPMDAALAYARTHLAGRSASSLRLTVRALRLELAGRLERELPRLEHLYLTKLMATHDAVEGLAAFLDKRPAEWTHQ